MDKQKIIQINIDDDALNEKIEKYVDRYMKDQDRALNS